MEGKFQSSSELVKSPLKCHEVVQTQVQVNASIIAIKTHTTLKTDTERKREKELMSNSERESMRT